MGITINKKSQQQNHRLKTDNSLSHRGLKCILLAPNLALDYAVVEVQEMFSSHGDLLTIAMYHHGETLVKLTHHDETKKRAHDSQIVRAKENSSRATVGPATYKHQTPTHRLKLYVRAAIESEA